MMTARAYQGQPYGVVVAQPSLKEAVDHPEASFLLFLSPTAVVVAGPFL